MPTSYLSSGFMAKTIAEETAPRIDGRPWRLFTPAVKQIDRESGQAESREAAAAAAAAQTVDEADACRRDLELS